MTKRAGSTRPSFPRFSHAPLIWESPLAWGWERRWQPSWVCSVSSSNPRPRRQLGRASSQLPLLRPLIYSSRNSGCASLSAPLEQEGFCHFSFLCDSSLSLPASQSPRPHTLGPSGMGDTASWMKPARELLPTACLGVASLLLPLCVREYRPGLQGSRKALPVTGFAPLPSTTAPEIPPLKWFSDVVRLPSCITVKQRGLWKVCGFGTRQALD